MAEYLLQYKWPWVHSNPHDEYSAHLKGEPWAPEVCWDTATERFCALNNAEARQITTGFLGENPVELDGQKYFREEVKLWRAVP